MKLCVECGQPIPPKKKSSAIYCSDAHYYLAKKKRSKDQYLKLKSNFQELQRNEKILAFLNPLASKKRDLFYDDLNALDFNFTISSNETIHEGKLCRIILGYAYFIHPESRK